MDRAGGLRRAVAADSAGEAEVLEEFLHPLLILALVGIDFRIGSFQVDRPDYAGSTVAGASEENRVQIELVDQAIHVDVAEAQARAGAPVAQQASLDVLGLEGFAQK